MRTRESALPGPMSDDFANLTPGVGLRDRTGAWSKLWPWSVIVIIAVAYLAHLSPGHDFVNDDFAAYVMHAANLVQGRTYTNIDYIPNPKALWLGPSNGYPPIYPLILAPVYKMFGLNLKSLKVVTVLCFVVFLVLFEILSRPMLSPFLRICALLILAFNPIFWNQRDYILSEFPYLMFSFGALLVIQRTCKNLTPENLKIGAAVLLSVLLYCSYGTRTIGIALLAAVVLADLLKFGRPSRFMMIVAAGAIALILAQTVLITSPTGYISAVRFSPRMMFGNAMFYAKTLSYVWQNGFSKAVQIVFALIFTTFAAVGFARNLWNERSAQEFYLLGYVGILIAWSAEIGLRGLLPVVPLYLVYGFEQIERVVTPLGSLARWSIAASLLIFCGATYAGEFRKEARQPAEANVYDAAAQELFSFLRVHTQPSEILIFPKPRSLALFTGRPVASFGPGESPEDSANFMRSIHSTILVSPDWGPPSWASFLAAYKGQLHEVFHNSEYQVFRVDWAAPDQVGSNSKHGGTLPTEERRTSERGIAARAELERTGVFESLWRSLL